MAARILELQHNPRWNGTRRFGDRWRDGRNSAAYVTPGSADLGRDELAGEIPGFRFWRGASAASYVHSVYSLLGCPELPAANYMLLRHTAAGRLTILHIGRVESSAPSLNLAEIRQLGASLGATEVHVHVVPQTAAERRIVELDLRAGLLGSICDHARPRLA